MSALSLDNNDSDDLYSFACNLTKSIDTYNSACSSLVDKPRYSVEINKKQCTVLADSGSSCTIMGVKQFQELAFDIKMSQKGDYIHAYGAHELSIVGSFKAKVKFDKIVVNDTIYVCEQGEKILLSCKTSQQLGLIVLNPNTVPVYSVSSSVQGFACTSTAISQYLHEHSELYTGIGKFRGPEIKLHIDPSIQPVIQRYRRVPFARRQKVEAELHKLQTDDIIERVDHPVEWCSPSVNPPKPKDPDAVRICVDMRIPNQAIKRERYVMPTVDDIVYTAHGAKLFTKLDMNKAYHQFVLDESSRHITTFATHIGWFRYKRLFFGINTASEIFQKKIHQLLIDIPGAINIADDILIVGKTTQEHDSNVLAVLERLRTHGLTINLSKCEFSKTSIDFFGLHFTDQGMKIDSKKADAILSMARPQSKAEVQSILGMLNFSARFIPHFSTLTQPLRELIKDDVEFQWGNPQETALDAIKKAIHERHLLHYFDATKATELYVDASPVGLGAILVQEGQTLAYGSKSLTPTEQNYSQLEREALAVVWSLEHFHLYVSGKPTTVFTDHKPLLGMFGKPTAKLTPRMHRWSLRLQPYDYTLHYRKGKDNPADYLSRHPDKSTQFNDTLSKCAESYVNAVIDDATPKALMLQQIIDTAIKDDTYQAVVKAVRTGRWHELKTPDAMPYRKVAHELSIADNDILMKDSRIVVPRELQQRTVNLAHEGHQGINKTKMLLREKVWFPGIDKMVYDKIQACLPCQSVVNKPVREPLKMTPLPSRPWSEVSVDFYGPLPQGQYLLVAIDDYSRFPEVEICSTTSARATIPLLDRIFATHGIPDVLRSDNGPPYQSSDFQQFMAHLGIRHRRVTPLWPEANGEVENFMKPLKKVCATAQVEGKSWKQALYTFLRNYRATPHCSTLKCPAEVLYGRPIKTKLPENAPKPTHDDTIRVSDDRAKSTMKANAERRRNIKNSDIDVGDKVLMRSSKKLKHSPVFDPNPFYVINRKGSMIIARRGQEVKARDASHFKKVTIIQEPVIDNQATDDDLDPFVNGENVDVQLPADHDVGNAPRRYPSRVRAKPKYLDDYVRK